MTAIAEPRRGDRRPLVIVIFLLAVLLVMGIMSRLNNANATTDSSGDTITNASADASRADWQDAVYQVTQVENKLFTNPDPTRVDEIMTDDCACASDTKTRLLMMKQTGRHVQGDNIHVDSVTLNQQVSPSEVRAFVVISDNNQPIVDSNGNVVSQSPRVDHSGLLYTMVRGDDGSWRIKDRSPISNARVEVK
jgi:hypothetical protein